MKGDPDFTENALIRQIAELFVDFSDQVKKGQSLAQLDQRSFKAKVAEAEAALQVEEVSIKAAQAKLERAQKLAY